MSEVRIEYHDKKGNRVYCTTRPVVPRIGEYIQMRHGTFPVEKVTYIEDQYVIYVVIEIGSAMKSQKIGTSDNFGNV